MIITVVIALFKSQKSFFVDTLQLLKLQLPLISSQKFVFLQFTSSISVLFLSQVKMYSTNWSAPNVWVFIAQ